MNAFALCRGSHSPITVPVFNSEKSEGTELPAILARLREFIETEEARLAEERQRAYRKAQDELRDAQVQRVFSGSDCMWTQITGSLHWYCRVNGRTYRLSPMENRMWQLCRVVQVGDSEDGNDLGRYRGRGDATKAVADMAHRPEPRI